MEDMLRNLMEDIVIHKLEDLIDILGICRCHQCRLDIASYALNRLPSKYVATTQGELLSKLAALDLQFENSVIAAIMNGAEIVKKNPRHDKAL